MLRRTPELQKQETERRIFEALLRVDPFAPGNRRLRFTELLKATDLARGTLNRTLQRMEEAGKVVRKVEVPPGRAVEVWYHWGPDADKIQPIIPSRRRYEELVKKFDPSLPSKTYLRTVSAALGKTFLQEIVVSLKQKRPILAKEILNEFRFVVGRHIIYLKDPTLREPKQIGKAFVDVEDHPEKYEPEFKELQAAIDELERW